MSLCHHHLHHTLVYYILVDGGVHLMKSKGHRLVQEGVKCEEGPVGLTRGAENMYVQ